MGHLATRWETRNIWNFEQQGSKKKKPLGNCNFTLWFGDRKGVDRSTVVRG